TYLNLASRGLFLDFTLNLKKAIESRGYKAPIRVLKADGGVLPLAKIRPVESIFSGPAASILGALAQSEPKDSFVVVDIGGTTTDIGLVLSGSPLISSKGAKIGSYFTNVRSLAVRSVPIGGDSVIIKENGEIKLANYRLGPAYCLGGNKPTPTDAMRYLNLTDYGNKERAEEAMASLLSLENKNTEKMRRIAQDIIDIMVKQICEAIKNLQKEWEEEPAYKVWEVLNPHKNLNLNILLSGGGASGIFSAIGKEMKINASLVKYSQVSNAIGAAMAKPTFSWTMNLDTFLGKYRIEETGEQGIWTGSKRPHNEVDDFLMGLVKNQASEMNIDVVSLEKDPFDYFPIVDNNRTVGQIVRGAMHVSPGVRGRVE
ncbi:MAG: hydantoinase/oxoprolinase family protein, partial [Eubacteriales bacterium]